MLYNLMFKLNEMGNIEFKWLAFVKSILNNTGLNYIWNHQEIFTVKKEWLKIELKQRLCDQYIQHWFDVMEKSSKGQFYSLFD